MGPQLPFDILVCIAEKTVFSSDNEFRLDLMDLKTLHFMFVNKACLYSFFYQFSRIRKVFLTNGVFELCCPLPVEGRDSKLVDPHFFQGPFNVNDWLFLVLLARGILSLKFVQTFYSLNGLTSYDLNSIQSLLNETPAESLIRLLLNKDSLASFQKMSPDCLASAHLALDCIKITDNAGVFCHLDRILNLNCSNIYIESVGAFSEFSPISIQRITANRTKHISLIYSVDINDTTADTKDFPFAHIKSVLTAIAGSCVSLNRLYVRFALCGEFSNSDFKVLSSWLRRIVENLANEWLTDIECHCELIVAFHAFFPESTLRDANNNAHELTKIGEVNFSAYKDECIIGEGDEDGMLSTPSSDELLPPCIISRLLTVDAKQMKKITYLLIGVEDEQNSEWQGFIGPAFEEQPINLVEWNGFDADEVIDDFNMSD